MGNNEEPGGKADHTPGSAAAPCFRRRGVRGRGVPLIGSPWQAGCPPGRSGIPVLSVNLLERDTGVIG